MLSDAEPRQGYQNTLLAVQVNLSLVSIPERNDW